MVNRSHAATDLLADGSFDHTAAMQNTKNTAINNYESLNQKLSNYERQDCQIT